MRRTKIVATLGPSTDNPRVMDGLIKVGLDVVRLNFSHGDPEEHHRRAELVRSRANAMGRSVAILGDLQGPKIRTARFVDGKVTLRNGQVFILDALLDDNAGDENRVGITYKRLPDEVKSGDTLVLDDGRIVLEVDTVEDREVHTRVKVGGVLSNNKGINLRGGGLSAPAITKKDEADIKLAADIGVDYLAVSFPRSAADILEARRLMDAVGCNAGIVAKIERAEALEAIDEIFEATDAIMVARGDLGVEIGDANLPAVQKELIGKAQKANKAVITATQMMESMIQNPIPTRAEVFDVANAVIDGTDAVMLSGESAVGAYPVKAVQAMSEICEKAEQHPRTIRSRHRLESTFCDVEESIAMATMYTANHLHVKAIAALTSSGRTAQWMSRISSSIPIYALTENDSTLRKVCLYRGVYPIPFDSRNITSAEANREAMHILAQSGVIEADDLVIITKGDLMGVGGGTNAMKIVKAGEWVEDLKKEQ